MADEDDTPRGRFDRLAHQICGTLVAAALGSLLLVGAGFQTPRDALIAVASIALGGAIAYLVGGLLHEYRERRSRRRPSVRTEDRT